MEPKILKGNKILCKFANPRVESRKYGLTRDFVRHYKSEKELWEETAKSSKYHESWDWLLSLILMIRKTDPSLFNYDAPGMAKFIKLKEEILSLPLSTPIEPVWEKCVTFAKHVNSKGTLAI